MPEEPLKSRLVQSIRKHIHIRIYIHAYHTYTHIHIYTLWRERWRLGHSHMSTGDGAKEHDLVYRPKQLPISDEASVWSMMAWLY